MRNSYSLSHLSHRAYDIGRIQTITAIPMEAGSSLELSIDGIARLAPPRKEIVSDCQFDICAFEIPYRIIPSWGQSFIDFIVNGPGNAPFAPTPVNIPAAYRSADYLLQPTVGAQINTLILSAYNSVYYNYYAVPSVPYTNNESTVTNDLTWYPTTEVGADRCRLYGRLAARLPHVLNGGTMVDAGGVAGWGAQSLQADDQLVPVNLGTGTFNLTDMADIQSRYKSKIAAAWFSHFYQDVMQEKFGSRIGPDADPRNLRPRMLGRQTMMLSGHDIDGTADATMATFQGKTLERIQFHMRRKVFQEHSIILVLGLFRYPLVHTDEVHPLLKKTTGFTYDEIVGDADRVGGQKPEQFNPQPWLVSTSTYTPVDTIQQPYGQHYRFQNNVVHSNFKKIPGYPFSAWNGVDYRNWLYYNNNEYVHTFQTTQIGQAQTQALIRATKYSQIPGVASSYYAGT